MTERLVQKFSHLRFCARTHAVETAFIHIAVPKRCGFASQSQGLLLVPLLLNFLAGRSTGGASPPLQAVRGHAEQTLQVRGFGASFAAHVCFCIFPLANWLPLYSVGRLISSPHQAHYEMKVELRTLLDSTCMPRDRLRKTPASKMWLKHTAAGQSCACL
eukprot:847145-Pelagomonas_calceolata.AAC.1